MSICQYWIGYKDYLGRVFGLSGPRPRALISGAHKSFIKLNLLVKAQWQWSCARYFQWFTGYLNHVDLLMSYVHVLKKLPQCLMCTWVVLWILFNDLSLHRIEISYEYFSSKICSTNPKCIIVSIRYLICYIIAIS